MAVFAILCAAALILYSALRFFRRRPGADLLDRLPDARAIRSLAWDEFEDVVCEAYRRRGFDARTRGGSKDGGVDVELRRDGKTILVQCKRWRNSSVGEPEIRELVGAVAIERADAAIFVTTGRLTKGAFRLARQASIEVVNGRKLAELVLSGQDARRHERLAAHEAEIRCPKCSAPMIRRSSKRRASAFFGCSAYPACTGTREV